LLDIAYHKAGIIKPGRPVITAETNPDVLALFQREADEKNAPLLRIGRDFDFSVQTTNEQGTELTISGPARSYPSLTLPAPGEFQQRNAALAVAGLDLLLDRGDVSFANDPVETVRTALENFSFPGRMEVVQQNPVVILDGAHNPHKVDALVKSVCQVYDNKKITAIMGMMRVKDAESVIRLLAPVVSRFIFTAPQVYGKRSYPPADLASIAAKVVPHIETIVVERVLESVRYGLDVVAPDELLLVTGSVYLVGEAREQWFPHKEMLRQLSIQSDPQID
jgi:dihydrofolate synthase/folylpolyglutamate synthase